MYRDVAAVEGLPLFFYRFIFSRRKSHRFSRAIQMAEKLRRLKVVHPLADLL
jgi:hypothetical protein